MKEIKLTGREMAAVRAIDYTTGSTGSEIAERTHIEVQELVDTLNGLTEAGYVEAYGGTSEIPFAGLVPAGEFLETRFEVNPSYALQLREAMRR